VADLLLAKLIDQRYQDLFIFGYFVNLVFKLVEEKHSLVFLNCYCARLFYRAKKKTVDASHHNRNC